jgi:Tfp pilus assembly protein PilN
MIRINLLKPEKKEVREAPAALPGEFKVKRKPPYGLFILLLIIIAIVALFFFQKNEIAKEQDMLRAAQEEKNSLQYVIAKLDELERQRDLLKKKINLIIDLKSQQANAVNIMDELSRNIPNWVWLTGAAFSENSVSLTGRSLSNNLLADYIYNLKQSPFFRNINLISSTQLRQRNNQFFEFSLSARYIPPKSSSEKAEVGEKGGQK